MLLPPQARGGELAGDLVLRFAGPPAGFAMPVEAAEVRIGRAERRINAVGTLRSNESVLVRPEVAGRVVAIGFEEGQKVKKGQPLLQLDASVEKAELAQAQAQLGLARANAERADELMRRGAAGALQKVVVSEAGASVYSASEFASKELPELDVSLRGAVSIARRLQDPLAELVKIEPKAIGVGQYQHDVNQVKLARALDAKVEDCVNAVGVDVNTASAPLLARVAGLSASVAENVSRSLCQPTTGRP